MPLAVAVGRSSGVEQVRQVEADVIADQLEAMIGQDCAENLTFGVITFYRAQEDAIWRALVARGLPSGRRAGAIRLWRA